MKAAKKKIVVMTAYDYSMASIAGFGAGDDCDGQIGVICTES
jgi:ketopantoate hydroxymethyltransferase